MSTNKADKNKGGRPITEGQTDEAMLSLLYAYKKEIGDKKITYKDLQTKTGISYNKWRDREIVKKKIDELNKIDLGLEDIDLLKYEVELLPQLGDFVREHYNEKKRVLEAVDKYEDFVIGMYSRLIENTKCKRNNTELQEQVIFLKNHNMDLQAQVSHY